MGENRIARLIDPMPSLWAVFCIWVGRLGALGSIGPERVGDRSPGPVVVGGPQLDVIGSRAIMRSGPRCVVEGPLAGALMRIDLLGNGASLKYAVKVATKYVWYFGPWWSP